MSKAENAPRMNTNAGSVWRGGCIPLALQLALLAALLVTVVLLVLTTHRHLDIRQEHAHSQAGVVALQPAAAVEQPLRNESRREDGLRTDVPVVTSASAPAAQVVSDSGLGDLRAFGRKAWGSLLLVAAACLGGVLLIGIWAARCISAPIRNLALALDRLSAGQQARVTVAGAPEVRQLQWSFNRAAQALHEHREMQTERICKATAELAEKNYQIERASQAKTRLMAAASHDLRQPLHALALLADGLGSGQTEPEQLERIHHVRDCVASLDHLFSELLDISQIDAGLLRPRVSHFELDRVMSEVDRNFRPVAEQRQLRLVLRPAVSWVCSDYAMLVRIVGNLVSNALKYTKHGGVLVAARQRGQRVRIDIVDTGMGIHAEHQQRIFDEFYQIAAAGRSAERGMGLGLATVQRLTDLLGAEVRLTSVVGRGTWVQVYLPLFQTDSDPVQKA